MVSARMKPRSKSVWISPAASGAFAPLCTVQARASFGPAVKKVMRPSSAYASVDHAREAGLVEAEIGQERVAFFGGEGRDLRLDRRRDDDRLRALPP